MRRIAICLSWLGWANLCAAAPTTPFIGRFFCGQGDTAYLQLLDTSYQMLYPSPGRLAEGLRRVVKGYERAESPQHKRMWERWQEATK